MRVLVFSDLQAHIFKRYAKHVEFRGKVRNSRLVNIIKAMRYMAKYAIKNDIKYILFSGDLFDERGKIPVEVWNPVHQEFKWWLKKGIVFIGIAGNHDASTRYDEYSMETFTELGKNYILLIDGIHNINKYWSVAGISHSDTMAEQIIKISKKDTGKFKLFLGHFLVGGSSNSLGFEFVSALPSIGEEELNAFDFCCIGDNHMPQLLGEKKRHVLSPGSLVAHDFGDANGKRGFWELDLRKNGKVRTKHIEVPAIKFHRVTVNKDSDLKLDDKMKYGFDVIKYIISSSDVHRSNIVKFKDKYPEVIIEFDIPKKVERRLNVTIDSDVVGDSINEYVTKFSGDLNPIKLKEIGEKLWKEVETQ